MIAEEYYKRLEGLIQPHNFSKTNFREKIKAEFEDPSEIEEKKKKNFTTSPEVLTNLQSEEERKLVEEYIQKMGVKEKDTSEEVKNQHSSDNKMKIYQKILENGEGSLDMLNTFTSAEPNKLISQSTKSNKTYSLSPSRRLRGTEDDSNLREKVHMLNIKTMNYRYEVETLKNKITELNKKNEDQQAEITKMEKIRESNNKYLIKLEGLLASGGAGASAFLKLNTTNTSKLNNSKILNFNPSTNLSKCENLLVEFNKNNNLIIEDKSNNVTLNLTDRNDIKEFIYNMMVENQKLKIFQSQVFEISKKYDDINENMIDGMKQIQQYLNPQKEEGQGAFHAENLDDNSKKDIISRNIIFIKNFLISFLDNFDKLIENVEKTIEIKQSEYNFLIESKEQEMKFLQEEILKLNDTVEIVKRDRLRDQKTINDYETELSYLNLRLEELNGKQSESGPKDESHLQKIQVLNVIN